MQTAVTRVVSIVKTIGEIATPVSGRISDRPIPPGTNDVLPGRYGAAIASHHDDGEARINGMLGTRKLAQAKVAHLRKALTLGPSESFQSLIKRKGADTTAICFVATANPNVTMLRRLSLFHKTAVKRIKNAQTLSVQL